jgi:hypothetical protein
MTITIDSSVLTAYYQAKAGVGTAASGGAGAGNGTGKTKTPTPPWDLKSSAPRAPALVKAVMSGARFLDPNAAKLDAAAPDDYRKLFALYQGLNALQGLSDQVNASGVSEGEKARIRARFAEGMAEIGKYIDTADFKLFDLAQGQATSKLQSTGGVKVETDAYKTGTLWTGAMNGEPPAFQGDVKFSLSVQKGASNPVTVNVDFDLAEMGATPRTMSNVVIYLNDKLAAAGLSTRFANERTAGADKTAMVGGKSVVIGKEPDSYALKIKGSDIEALSFSAPATAPAVYLGGAAGRDTDKADPSLSLTKFEVGGADVTGTAAANGKIFSRPMDAGVSAIKSQVVGADGSLYMLAEVDAKVDGQTIKGTSDVALLKYDPGGNLVYSRTLGAASSASGFALAVSADGASVAVAGSVTGVLDAGDAGKDPNTADSFVTVFSAAGEEKWTQRSAATLEDKVTGLAFAADGSLYATGTTASAMPGATAVGGQDAYLRGFSATGAVKFTSQYGTAGVDSSAGLIVDGNSVVVAGSESGQAVLRRFDLQPAGAPTLASSRSLGALNGNLAGIGLAADGSIVVTGSTSNGSLSVGGATTGYPGQQAAFVAKLNSDLTTTGGDHLTYLAGSSARTASAMTISGGQVYLAGQISVTPLPGDTSAHDSYVQAIDPDTGAVSWSRQTQGLDREAAITALAVDAGGASALDRLGLPQGKIDWKVSDTLVANTAARVGDQLTVRSSMGPKTVTIEASDTLKTLATKIGRAAGFNVKVETTLVDGVQKLKVTPIGKAEIELEAGPKGRDALGALGLGEALITNDPTKAADAKKAKTVATYGLGLPSTLNLDTPAAAKQASSILINAAVAVRGVYNDLIKPPTTPSSSSSGQVPAYLQAQIANYQLALARLTGGG